jgi:2-polyprenyl-3-methyl-5-hydroxy-6-metoxy-1,4-benzoquinol methylase
VVGARVAERPRARRRAGRRAAAPRPRASERGAGLALPSVVAARAGADVLATDGSSDAVAFAAHVMAINEVEGEVACADWSEHGDQLVARGPFDLVLAADVMYTRANVNVALRLLPRLVTPSGTVLLADPNRAGAQDFLAAARATFTLTSERGPDISLHTLRLAA